MRCYRVTTTEQIENVYEIEVEDDIDEAKLREILWDILWQYNPVEIESIGQTLTDIAETTFTKGD